MCKEKGDQVCVLLFRGHVQGKLGHKGLCLTFRGHVQSRSHTLVPLRHAQRGKEHRSEHRDDAGCQGFPSRSWVVPQMSSAVIEAHILANVSVFQYR